MGRPHGCRKRKGALPERPAVIRLRGSALADYAAGVAPIRNFLVPQTTHIAWVAGLPFFMVTPTTSRESVFALHLTQ